MSMIKGALTTCPYCGSYQSRNLRAGDEGLEQCVECGRFIKPMEVDYDAEVSVLR